MHFCTLTESSCRVHHLICWLYPVISRSRDLILSSIVPNICPQSLCLVLLKIQNSGRFGEQAGLSSNCVPCTSKNLLMMLEESMKMTSTTLITLVWHLCFLKMSVSTHPKKWSGLLVRGGIVCSKPWLIANNHSIHQSPVSEEIPCIDSVQLQTASLLIPSHFMG